ncbi:uncharacterized protein EAF02_009687 [Botrytis sinoallii]|uniref:uncharacterized protein n=1 Tax=Botrytis sinoallii TaxID=1463999 RepID=UPI0018FF90EF|nr:uncharacterized protein EAF02_009687 [Botrytis sinoallii]KAF7867496.1 hypothetical protein EAF02_009687 [Botrytis sinoallii]
MVFTILVFLGFTLAQIILLVPHPGENWLEMYQEPREMAVLKISVPISVTSFIVDVYTFITPIAGVSGLKLSRKRKIGVLMILITGLCACIASSLSIYYKTRLTTIDSAWDSIPVIICALGSEPDENLRKKASANGREREVEMGEDTLFEIEMGDLGRGKNQVKIISGNMNGHTDVT